MRRAAPAGCRPASKGVVLWLLAYALGPAAVVADEAPARDRRAIRRSDVVFMYDNPSLYETYACTVLGWAGAADRGRIELAHKKGVRLYAAHIGFRTEFRRVIDFGPDFMEGVCRDLDGNPITVPWLWDHEYKGQPCWHWCTNSPFFRRYLYHRLEEVARAEPDGLQIDDYTGTAGPAFWGRGCFCRYCMEGFRRFLEGKLTKERLRELGIPTLAGFDYGAFLRKRGLDQESFAKKRWGLPLYREFLEFQLREATQFVAGYHKKLCELAGRRLTLSVNSPLVPPERLAIAPYLSYFCSEVDHQAAKGAPPRHPITIYKLADGVAVPVASTASGRDWDYVKEHEASGLVRSWIALSYAFGHTFMAPHRQWCYNPKKGTHWYTGPTEEYAYVYRFVRRNADLLDGYEAVAPVAVLYDNRARRAGKGAIEPMCTELAEASIPFTVVVHGDEWLPLELTEEELRAHKVVLVPGDIDRDDLPAALKSSGRGDSSGGIPVLRWPEERERFEALFPRPIRVAGARGVIAVARHKPGNLDAPCVVHLLNRNYERDKDATRPVRDFSLRLRRELFGRTFKRAELIPLGGEKREIRVSSSRDETTVEVPSLDLWAIVRLD